MDNEERMQNLKDGRSAHAVSRGSRKAVEDTTEAGGQVKKEDLSKLIAQAPPGADEVNYASLAGN